MAKTFTLTIELGNDEMKNGEQLYHAVATAAAQVREYNEEELKPHVAYRKIYDVNGNTVGKWEVT